MNENETEKEADESKESTPAWSSVKWGSFTWGSEPSKDSPPDENATKNQ
jgi:hypothetical protein